MNRRELLALSCVVLGVNVTGCIGSTPQTDLPLSNGHDRSYTFDITILFTSVTIAHHNDPPPDPDEIEWIATYEITLSAGEEHIILQAFPEDGKYFIEATLHNEVKTDDAHRQYWFNQQHQSISVSVSQQGDFNLSLAQSD